MEAFPCTDVTIALRRPSGLGTSVPSLSRSDIKVDSDMAVTVPVWCIVGCCLAMLYGIVGSVSYRVEYLIGA